jgi:hypothetical protein
MFKHVDDCGRMRVYAVTPPVILPLPRSNQRSDVNRRAGAISATRPRTSQAGDRPHTDAHYAYWTHFRL